MYPITTCPAEFGKRAKARAKRLLAAFGSPKRNRSSLRAPVQAVCHRVSGKVWLIDEWERTAVLHRGKLHDWHSCLSCGSEGIAQVFFADPEFGPKRCGFCGERALWL